MPTPLYHQIYLVLRTKIIDGEYAGGDLLPSEEETARSRWVSSISAKRALNELAEDGLVQRALGCGFGDRVRRAVRLRRLEGEPFSHLTTYVPEDIGGTYGRDDLASTPLLTLLERGAPLLRIGRIVYDRRERAVEYITGLYRPDRYRYRTNLSRVRTDRANAWSPSG